MSKPSPLPSTDAYNEEPDNLLYAAWHYRLAHSLADRLDEWRIAWAWAIPLAIVNGLLLWWLSDDAQFSVQIAGTGDIQGYNSIPRSCCSGGQSAQLAVLTYLCVAGRHGGRTWLASSRRWRFWSSTCSCSIRARDRPSSRNSI